MCTTKGPRHGASLSDGQAHTDDHHRWTRRDFLARTALAATGLSFVHRGVPVHAFSGGLLPRLAEVGNDRILVLIQLVGGNDGLNTVIPVRDDHYYRLRPGLAVPGAETFALDDRFGIHHEASGFEALWEEGQMAVVHSVGYEDPVLSHFASLDIWSTASDAGDRKDTGWLGQYLDEGYAHLAGPPPEGPLAVQIGGYPGLLFRGSESDLSFSMQTHHDIRRIVGTCTLYDP
jgi:uncharacterized protein (DUF1501 family)